MILSWLTLALLSSPAHAVLDEPLDTIIFSRIETALFPEGLCLGNPQKSPPVIPAPREQPQLDLPELMDLDRKIQAVARSVQAAYNVPDFESVSSGAELTTRGSSFIKQLPPNYRFYAYFSEPEYGIKLLLLRPETSGAKLPLILSVIGTQSLLPWIDKFLAGEAESLRSSRLVRMFTTCQYFDEFARPLPERGLIITGHSLGGGMAEAIAYLIQAKRISTGLTPLAMELITFNSFGGKSLVEKMETYDPAIAALIPARNYFVGGDIVHEMGEHVGPLYDLGSPNRNDVGLENPMFSHMIGTVINQGMRTVMMLSAFITARQSTVEGSRPLEQLKTADMITYALPDQIIPHSKARIIELLNEAALTLELSDLTRDDSRETARFVGRLISSRELSLRDGLIFDSEMVRELKAVRQRIYRSVP